MAKFVEECQHLEIQLDDINKATNNFHKDRIIGHGGFGNVYIGEISHSKGRSMAAFKLLNRTQGQGDLEFFKEIRMLSCYTHGNLISLLGFCNHEKEKILVYEYASRGSLDRHLDVAALSWMQRLKICLGAAKGLSYLHDDKGTHERVIHRDIKSANILLDDDWNAKVSDFGLSKMAPANQQYSDVVTNPVGTYGYLDPNYKKNYSLTKESDVYSFGVVLFEVLCGRLCPISSNGRWESQVDQWKIKYEEKELHKIIFKDMMQQMDSVSLKKFSDIAYQCLQESQRPMMTQVVETLEIALQYQEVYERVELPEDYEEMLMTMVTPLHYSSKSELKMFFVKGILLNGRKTWFSLNMSGKHCEMISVAECLIPVPSEPGYKSRFAVGCYEPSKFKTHVRTQFLSSGITYTVNLIFKKKSKDRYIGLEYQLEGERKSYSFLSDEREDGWLTAELYQFTSNQKTVDLKILFDIKHCPTLVVEGIEFQPLEKMVHNKKVEMQPISDTETYWGQKLPNDYEDIISLSKYGVQWTTNKELYLSLRQGFPINNGNEWFSLANDGKKCLMLSAREVLLNDKWKWKFMGETRFEVAHHTSSKFDIVYMIKNKMLSPETTYATYLVYKQDGGVQPAPAQVKDKNSHSETTCCHIYLRTPQTPVIISLNDNQNTHNPSHRPKLKGLPQRRSDGWMEVHIWEFQTDTTAEMIPMNVGLSSYDKSLEGIQVQGIEFRPI